MATNDVNSNHGNYLLFRHVIIVQIFNEFLNEMEFLSKISPKSAIMNFIKSTFAN